MQERVRVIVIENNSILVIKRTIRSGVHYVFPGGGVEPGEMLETAVVREALEETGLQVEIASLLHKRVWDSHWGMQMEYFYACTVTGGTIGTGSGPEFQPDSKYEGTHEPMMMPIEEFMSVEVQPDNGIRDILFPDKKSPH